MKKQHYRLGLCLLAIFILSACSEQSIQTVEVTRLVPQTVIATRGAPQTVVVTPTRQLTRTSTLPPTLTPTVENQPTRYYDGVIVITQYYTFLGNGLYEEAYHLLSSSAQKPHSLEDYIVTKSINFHTVQIITIQPFDEWRRQQDAHFTPDPPTRPRFFVQIIATGEGGMSGSAINGTVQDLFLTVIQENGEWKIDDFATGPVP